MLKPLLENFEHYFASVWDESNCVGRRPRVPGCDSAEVIERSYPTSEVRGSGWKQLPHAQGVVAALAQEGLKELLHVQGQEGQGWRDTPHSR